MITKKVKCICDLGTRITFEVLPSAKSHRSPAAGGLLHVRDELMEARGSQAPGWYSPHLQMVQSWNRTHNSKLLVLGITLLSKVDRRHDTESMSACQILLFWLYNQVS